MKKYTALVLALMMVFTLCACSEFDDMVPADEQLSKEHNNADELEGTPEGMTQMVNPINEITESEMEGCIGIPLPVPFGAYDTIWTTIAGDVMIGQVDFMYDGVPYCYRVQKTDALQDISGVYLSDPITPEDLENAYSLAKCDGEYCVALWYVDGYSYSVSCATDDHELIETMRSLLGG